MKRKQILVLIIFLAISLKLISQNSIDYQSIRNDKVHNTCVKPTLEGADLTIKDLSAIDTSKIIKGLYEYWFDMGMSYYMKALMFKQDEFRYKDIECFNKCVRINKKNSDAYRNLANCYYFYKKYDLVKVNLELYKKYCGKKYLDKGFIAQMEKLIKK